MFRFRKDLAQLTVVVFVALLTGCTQAGEEVNLDPTRVGYYGYGSPASHEMIAGWDIDIRPDGLGLPAGSGSVEDGEWLYEDQCAECHGSFGEGVGRFPVLAGGQDSLRDDRPSKTVGSYWRYTSTLFDYIRRTMPFTQPESLSAADTYAITAYVLYLNDLVADDFVLSQENLPAVHLPNEGNFVPDPRPDVANLRCMSDCRDPAGIQVLSQAESAPIVAKSPNQATYDQFCSICHDLGVAGAPKFADSQAWVARIERGLPAMIANAINGVSSESGMMPAKGGFAHLSDDEVAAAVEFIVEASR